MLGPQHIVISFILTILIPGVCLIGVSLLLKYVAKVSWLTAIPAAVLVATLFSIAGVRMNLHPGVRVGIGSFVLVPAAVCAVILFVQFFRWLFATGAEGTRVNTAERNRILQMVEDGKISTDEGAELLDAMGRSSALQGQDKFSRLDIAILCGVALVILGFFLVWEHLGRGMYQAGHHRGAVGWTIFIVAILSAVPVFVTPKDLLYKISMLQIFLILVGLALMIKELIVINENLGVGLILCLVGFAVELLTSGAKLKQLAA